MVSIDEKISLEKSLNESPKALALFHYLKNLSQNVKPLELSETDRTYYLIIDALNENNDYLFKNTYEELSKRKVSRELPIIYDNYLLFILLIGVVKFNLKTEWIRSVIGLRITSNEPERSITISFLNFLNKNYLTNDGIPSIVLACLIKFDDNSINAVILKSSFQVNDNSTHYLEKDLFLVSILLFTNQYIISFSIGDEPFKLKRFETIFLKRISLIEDIFYYFILGLLILLWFYTIHKFPKIKDTIGDLGTFLGVVGIGILAIPLNSLKSFFGKAVKSFFGYKSDV